MRCARQTVCFSVATQTDGHENPDGWPDGHEYPDGPLAEPRTPPQVPRAPPEYRLRMLDRSEPLPPSHWQGVRFCGANNTLLQMQLKARTSDDRRVHEHHNVWILKRSGLCDHKGWTDNVDTLLAHVGPVPTAHLGTRFKGFTDMATRDAFGYWNDDFPYLNCSKLPKCCGCRFAPAIYPKIQPTKMRHRPGKGDQSEDENDWKRMKKMTG